MNGSEGWVYPMIDPVILDLPGPLALRWYGMMYVVGFVAAFHILTSLSRRGRQPLPEDKNSEFIGWIAMGVFFGGRIGYVLFYRPEILREPLRWLAVWEGGLSFHGGVLGSILATYLYMRKIQRPFLHLTDVVVLATPPGVFAVRCANFINGELYGRVTTAAVPWAMRFPTDPVALDGLGIRSSAAHVVYEAVEKAKAAGTYEQIMATVPLRHPSQLYEAFLEGVVLFGLLWSIVVLARRFSWRLKPGSIFAFFMMGYALMRGLVENFRQPDAQFRDPSDPLGVVLGPLTMGQTLSVGFIVIGLAFLWIGRKQEELALPIWPDGPPTQLPSSKVSAKEPRPKSKKKKKKKGRRS